MTAEESGESVVESVISLEKVGGRDDNLGSVDIHENDARVPAQNRTDPW